MSRYLTVAAAQFACVSGDIAANAEKHLMFIERARGGRRGHAGVPGTVVGRP